MSDNAVYDLANTQSSDSTDSLDSEQPDNPLVTAFGIMWQTQGMHVAYAAVISRTLPRQRGNLAMRPYTWVEKDEDLDLARRHYGLHVIMDQPPSRQVQHQIALDCWKGFAPYSADMVFKFASVDSVRGSDLESAPFNINSPLPLATSPKTKSP